MQSAVVRCGRDGYGYVVPDNTTELDCLIHFSRMDPTKPYIYAATFCERILREPDGRISIIGITTGARAAVPSIVRLYFVLAIRGGLFHGSNDIALNLELPSGEKMLLDNPGIIPFTADPEAVSFHDRTIEFPIVMEGTYLFEVTVSGVPLCSVPLTIENVASPPPSIPLPSSDAPRIPKP